MEEKIEKQYSNGEVTVVWQPDLCIHSAMCVRGLPQVFNTREKPWINIKGAGTDAIIQQVSKCPSGALSYFKNENQTNEVTEKETIIEVTKNGPIMVYGNLTVKHTDGTETKKNRVTAFCRCGGSSNKPYCDGTHRKINFEG
jgi:uncharacterized Fe-S cluster protein YjdI